MKDSNAGAADAAATTRRVRKPEAIVLSADDSFLIELGPLLGERFRTRPVDSPADLPEPGTANWFAIIDASTRERARALVGQIENRHPDVPLIVIHSDKHLNDWQQALQRGHVCALVRRSELNAEQMNNALQTAVDRLHNPPPNPMAMSGASSPFSSGGAGLRYTVLAVLLIAAAAGAWWWYSRPAAPTVAALLPAAVAPPAVSAPATAPAPAASAVINTPAAVLPAPARSVEELLSAARVAFAEQRNLLPRGALSPSGDSVLELYAAALQQQPGNEEAREGLTRLFAVARSRMQTDLAAGKLDEAQRMLTIFKSAGLQSDATRALEADIQAAKPRWLLAQARQSLAGGDVAAAEQWLAQAVEAGADRGAVRDTRKQLDSTKTDQALGELAAQVRAAIGNGALLEPAADNARSRLAALRQQSRTSPITLAVQRELQSALLARAQTAIRDQQLEAAQRYITAGAEYGNSNELAETRKSLQSAADQASARAAQAEAARLAAATTRATGSSDDEARSCVAPKPKRLNTVYPESALVKNLTGYVIVQFTLDANGRASNTSVYSSEPAGVFDQSALNAVARGRFDPSVLGDSQQPRCARLRISFKPVS